MNYDQVSELSYGDRIEIRLLDGIVRIACFGHRHGNEALVFIGNGSTTIPCEWILRKVT